MNTFMIAAAAQPVEQWQVATPRDFSSGEIRH
jgi:hypothetical protein